MPKVEKVRRSEAARMAANPTAAKRLPLSSSSKKKKGKKSSSGVGHAATLGEEMEQLSNPGKLRPIALARGGSKKKKKSSSSSSSTLASGEEAQLENELRIAGEVGKGKLSKRDAGDDGDAGMDDDEQDDDENVPDAGDTEEGEGEDGSDALSARMSRKILQAAHKQQQEELEGEGEDEEKEAARSTSSRMRQLMSFGGGEGDDGELDEEVDLDEDEDDDVGDDDGDVEEMELTAEERQSLEMFSNKPQSGQGRSLADILLAKIREKEAESSGGAMPGQLSAPPSNVRFGPGFFGPSSGPAHTTESVRARLDPKVVDVYTKVGQFLSHYSSGKVPKAFKVIPNLKSWEEVLLLTNPDGWSVQAHFVATRLFASAFNPKLAQRFYSLILLPKIRSDIEQHKQLNFHLYQALKKSLYKPAAFFKGILLPLAEEGATSREAVIMSSILAKCTIPVLHSSVALLKLAEQPYSGTNALFIKTLLGKKYALPRKVVAQLVQYFCKFSSQSAGGMPAGHMPLIWHQTLLTFVQRYKLDLTDNQRTAIRNLIKVQNHHGISAEIRRELLSAKEASTGATSSSGHNASTAPIGSFHAAFAQANTRAPTFTSLADSMKNPNTLAMMQESVAMES